MYRGIMKAGPQAGEWVGVLGSAEGLGHLGVQFARAKGLRAVGVDAREWGFDVDGGGGCGCGGGCGDGEGGAGKGVQKARSGEEGLAVDSFSDVERAAALACTICRIHGEMIQIAQGFSFFARSLKKWAPELILDMSSLTGSPYHSTSLSSAASNRRLSHLVETAANRHMQHSCRIQQKRDDELAPAARKDPGDG